MRARTLVTAVSALLGLDLLLLLVTGTSGPLSALGLPAGPGGFALRLLALGVLLTLRLRVMAAPERRLSAARLLLGLLLLPTLWQFQFAGGRLGGDGVMYYVYVRSFLKDGDVNLMNEYDHYGLLSRADVGSLRTPTKTGLARSIFAVGPAVVAIPPFLVGEAVARGQALLGQEADLSGYGPCHRNAVALGNLLYGFLAVLLIHATLRRHFADEVALLAALLTWLATFLHWYMVQQPVMSHAPSAFGGALVIWLWDRHREGRTTRGYLLLGLLIGLAMCIRWQNGVLLILPGVDLLGALWASRTDGRRMALPVTRGLLVLATTFVGALPQMLVWKAMYDMYVLPYPPHGRDFVRLDHPFVLVTFFSSRHGLFAWTPVFWAAYLGFVPLLVRRWRLGTLLCVPLVLMTYVNLCSGDWWAGGSFSNRRFDSLLPVLAFGLAASAEWAIEKGRGRGPALLALGAGLLAAWNLTLLLQARRGALPREGTVAFPDLVGGSFGLVAQAVGSPNTWPASWLFALREGRPPDQYDVLVGRYLFYRQNNLGGKIPVGTGADDRMLGEGWGPRERLEEVPCRALLRRARVFAPLDVPEELLVKVRLRAPVDTAVRLSVNGQAVGEMTARAEWAERAVLAPAPVWRRELNDVVLESGGEVRVAGFEFVRKARP